jgi:hypothetical protein
MSFVLLWFSKAHCCFAALIWRRLLMQALWGAVLGLWKEFGIEIAAIRAMKKQARSARGIALQFHEDFFSVSLIQTDQHRAVVLVAEI